MMNKFFFLIGIALFASALSIGCGFNTEADITVSDAVLKSAKVEKFDYVGTLEKARKGDREALKSFFDYSRFTDGTDAFDHAQTCLEMIPFANDATVASVLTPFKPGLKKAILERMAFAQTKTTKENLKAPLQELFPMTYTVLKQGEEAEMRMDSVQRAIRQKGYIDADSIYKAKGSPALPEDPKKK